MAKPIDDVVALTITGVGADPRGGTVFLLTAEGESEVFPVWMTAEDADQILQMLDVPNAAPPRHVEALLELARAAEQRIDAVQLVGVRDGALGAAVRLASGSQAPCDGVQAFSLAAQGIPLHASRGLLAKWAARLDSAERPEPAAFRPWSSPLSMRSEDTQ